MDQKNFLEQIKNPDTYGNKVENVKIIQTHISFVALTGNHAYKFKKPVNFGFLDFSTLDKRKYFCSQEIKLNKRLCPEIYEEVVPITKKDNSLQIQGDGEIIDYAVKMKQFSQQNIMTNLLGKGEIDEELIDKIVKRLNQFYKQEESTEEIKKYGQVKTIKQNTDENFQQTENVVGVTIDKEVFDFIKNATNKFLEDKNKIFEERIKNGFICDCHGDLHSGNIVIDEGEVCIFDCIEFNKRFRYSDLASDLAFLAMDLDYLGHPYLSSYLISKYVEISNDKGIFNVLNFYKCYRAYVRGKVIGFRLNDPNIKDSEKEDVIKTTKNYFRLAHYYAKLFSIKNKESILFVTSGLTGTGKTTIARKIAVDYNASVISTDMIRKELEGIQKYERHHDEYNTGLYSPEKMEYTYEKVMEKAEKPLKKGINVVLDATFKSIKHRNMAKQLAGKTNSKFLILHCNCPEKTVKKYLDERVKKKSVSDGRWEIYVQQKDSFEDFSDFSNVIKIDVSNKSTKYQLEIYNNILDKVAGD